MPMKGTQHCPSITSTYIDISANMHSFAHEFQQDQGSFATVPRSRKSVSGFALILEIVTALKCVYQK